MDVPMDIVIHVSLFLYELLGGRERTFWEVFNIIHWTLKIISVWNMYMFQVWRRLLRNIDMFEIAMSSYGSTLDCHMSNV